jgi:hypothetical protein
MNKNKRLKALEQKVFELEGSIAVLEIFINNLMQSQGMKIELESEKWYAEKE